MRTGIVSSELLGHVAGILYDYPANKARLQEMRDQIEQGTIPRTMGRQAGNPGDSTGHRATRLAELSELYWVKWVEAIDKMLAIMPQEHVDLIRMRYFEKREPGYICRRLLIGHSTYFALVKLVLRDVIIYATQVGLIRPVQVRQVRTARD